MMVVNCLRLMNKYLKVDICGLEDPGSLFSSVDLQTILFPGNSKPFVKSTDESYYSNNYSRC
jgi:hypothetical protein